MEQNTYIVTGAGGGIGRAVANKLGNLGASVVVSDVNDDAVGSVVSEIKNSNGEALGHSGDITSLAYTEELVYDTIEMYDHIHGVCNFAGVLRDSISYKMTESEWDQVIDIHLKGHFSLLRNVGSHWREQSKENDDWLDPQRSFLTISSRAAAGNVGQVNYSAAKAGILGMTRTAARELERYNIRVNSLMPRAFTDMIKQLPEEQRSFTREEMPPEKIAPMVAFLLSEDAHGISGCTFLAAGDTFGLVSNPKLVRSGTQPGGWTVEELSERFRDEVVPGENLQKTGERNV